MGAHHLLCGVLELVFQWCIRQHCLLTAHRVIGSDSVCVEFHMFIYCSCGFPLSSSLNPPPPPSKNMQITRLFMLNCPYDLCYENRLITRFIQNILFHWDVFAMSCCEQQNANKDIKWVWALLATLPSFRSCHWIYDLVAWVATQWERAWLLSDVDIVDVLSLKESTN